MALNIKNPEVERLAAEVAALSNTSLTRAVLSALQTRHTQLLRQRSRKKGVAQARELLAREFWAQDAKKPALDDDTLLGYGKSGA